eukprot:superscaffoldBa00002744_g15162
MEVLANAAVAEICQLVDDGFDTLRLEISRSQRENLALKSRLRLMEPIPALVVTHTSKDHHFGEDPTSGRRHVKSTSLENTDSQLSRPVVETVQPVEPEVDVIKKERLEEEQTSCSVVDHQTAPSSSNFILNAMPSFSNSSSDSRSKGLPSSTERVFSCPQCSALLQPQRPGGTPAFARQGGDLSLPPL